MEAETVAVLVVGGGVCGVLAGQRCAAKGMSFRLVDAGEDFGGVWRTLANTHSQLQAFEALYRWDASFPLGHALAKLSSGTVRDKLRAYARLHGLYARATFCSTVLTVHFDTQTDRYLATVRNHDTGDLTFVSAEYLMAACGLLGKQYTPEERLMPSLAEYRGFCTLAGRADGRDSLVGSSDQRGKEVVVVGSGAFACEAMEAAAKAGAAKVTLVSRERERWILPFSRQFTITWMTYMPLVPWRWKMALVRLYLRRCFYGPARLMHAAPTGAASAQDFTGQCNDAIFQLSRAGVASILVDSVAAFARDGVFLRSGRFLRADTLVFAVGCTNLSPPPFLMELGPGQVELHNYAFLGPSGRVGTASDVTYGYVPVGPKKQLDMFFHGMECRRRGQEAASEAVQALKAALQPTSSTPLGGNSSSSADTRERPSTWFHSRHWWSSLNSAMEDRSEAYKRTMCVGLTWWQSALLRAQLIADSLGYWVASCLLSCVELSQLPVL